jgi:IclR family transcriptional regulator, KDG regulon repressor
MSSILEKAVQALDYVAAVPEGVTVTDLADSMRTSKSTASRLLASLVDAGLLERDEAQRHFLDVRFWSWGAHSVRRLSVLDVARPHVANAVRELGVSVYLTVAREDKAIYLENMAPLAGYPFMNLVSYVVPIYACAPGKAMLAFASAERIQAILGGPLERFTSNTFATKEELSDELERIRSLGYAVNRGEYADNGRIAVAVPVFDHTGSAVAAVCFHDLQGEASVPQIILPLVELGRTISSSLGYSRAAHHMVG